MSSSTRLAPLADLRFGVQGVAHRPGTLRRLEGEVVVPALQTGGVGVAEGDSLELDLRLEGVAKGVVVEGFISGQWTAECSRCLTPVVGPFSVEVHELFEDEPVEGDSYLLARQHGGEQVDLEPLVRDAVLLTVPAAPLCTDDCAGLCSVCGTDRNVARCDCTVDTTDPRWAALDQLEVDAPDS